MDEHEVVENGVGGSGGYAAKVKVR